MILTALSVKRTDGEAGAGNQTRLCGSHNDWFVPGLYINELRRTWSVGLFYAIILFFAIPVYVLLAFSSSDYYIDHPERARSLLEVYFSGANPFVTIYALLGGIICALLVAQYLFDRRKTNFVCSLPVKRQAYFLSATAASLTWSVFAWITSLLFLVPIALLTPAIRSHLGVVIGGFFVMLLSWLCIHLYFYGLTMLACAFCGTSSMGIGMCLMLGGYVPAAVLSLIGLAGMSFSNINSNYYLNESLFSALSGVFRISIHTAKNKSPLFLLGCAGLGVLFLAISVLLCTVRRSEKAGTPFAFDRVRDLVKYLLMALATLLGGMLFWAMSDGSWSSIFWLLFGCVCGGLLSWMICNTIFYKTPKMMFTGRRSMALVLVIVTVCTLGARLDPFRVDAYIPSDAMTRCVTLSMNGGPEITIRDKSLLRIYNTMAKNGQRTADRHGTVELYWLLHGNEKIDNNVPARAVYFGESVWNTWYLLPVARSAYALYADWCTFVQALTARDNFADIYLEELYHSIQKDMRASPQKSFHIMINTRENVLWDGFEGAAYVNGDALLALLDIYRENIRAHGADAMQYDCIGDMRVKTDSGYVMLPIFSYNETFNEAAKKMLGGPSGDYVMEYDYETTFVSATVFRHGVAVAELSEEEWAALLRDGKMTVNTSSAEWNPLMLFDTEYNVVTVLNVVEKMQEKYDASADEYGYTEKETDVSYTNTNTYKSTLTGGFWLGQTPDGFGK